MGMKREKKIRALIICAITAAYACRMVNAWPNIASFIRIAIYLTLFTGWGISLKQRIQQRQVQSFLLFADALMLVWLLLRTLKFYAVRTDVASRYLWYLYYIPMLFIPMLGVMVALSLGKPDDYCLPKKYRVLWVITIAIVVLILTNDWHELAFQFPAGQGFWKQSDDCYSYGPGYYLVVFWEIICATAAFLIMAVKCRVPNIKKYFWLPLLPLVFALIYTVLYYLSVEWLRDLFGDMTVTLCLLFAAAFEACIYCGLIQSNTRYADLFASMADNSAMVVDEQFQLVYAAKGAEQMTKKIRQLAKEKPFELGNGRVLHTMPIHSGYAVWIQDNSKILALTEELEIIREELSERNGLLRMEYEEERKRKEAEEQNRLYDRLQVVSQKQINQIDQLVREYHQSEHVKGKEQSKQILAKIVVLCSYIKRRKHLELLGNKDCLILMRELSSAVNESFRALKLLGVSSSLYVDTEKQVILKDATRAYTFFEDALEMALESLTAIDVRMVRRGKLFRIAMSVSCNMDLSQLEKKYPDAEIDYDEEEWSLLLILNREGEAR